MPRPLYLFEFCDQPWVHSSVRECLFELMDFCNSGIRSFNSRVAEEALKMAKEGGVNEIVELGAGRAPITVKLANDPRADNLVMVPCDLFPNETVFRQLEEKYQGKVKPIYTPVDITQTHSELNNKILVMAAMFHHVPFNKRTQVLKSLSETSSRCVIFEPLKRSWTAIFLCLFVIFPVLIFPLAYWKNKGFLRRALWCWVVPVVPVMFIWDGIVSCLRQWTVDEYLSALKSPSSKAIDVEVDDQQNMFVLRWLGSLH
jgi:hypothetical protein